MKLITAIVVLVLSTPPATVLTDDEGDVLIRQGHLIVTDDGYSVRECDSDVIYTIVTSFQIADTLSQADAKYIRFRGDKIDERIMRIRELLVYTKGVPANCE